MRQILILFLYTVLGYSKTFDRDESEIFPKYFKFGTASSAYQVEGGWNADGKGPSIWDDFTNNYPELIMDHSNGNVGPNSYEFYKEDVELLKNTSVDFYRFSISWPRILPTGSVSKINEAGIQYYNNLIDELLANNIEPLVTMFHWDLPSTLQQLGGLTNSIIANYFEGYAEILFDRFGDRVKLWTTFNEPMIYCENGHGHGERPPLIYAPGVGNYLCGHNMLLANARVYDLYQEKYKKQFGGKVGFVIDCHYYFPKDPNNLEHITSAEKAMQFYCGWMVHPLFNKNGGYPPIMVDIIAERSKQEGRAWSRLPAMSEKDKTLIKGKSDFLGINYYTSRLVEPFVNSPPVTSFFGDQDIQLSYNSTWKKGYSTWLYSVPHGLRNLLNWLKSEMGNVEVIVTESGWSDNLSTLNDIDRIEFLQEHLQAVKDAILIDGCNVTGYTYWSLLNNFEWLAGYTEGFGLYHVNMSSPKKERTAKASVSYFKNVIKTRRLKDF